MTSLLVELVIPEPTSIVEREAILDSIMEKVHTANTVGSKQARLFREYIWFAKPGKPFVRTDKNTVKRRDTVVLYEEEIEQFYKSMEENGNLAANVDVASLATISKSVHHLLATALPETKEIGPDIDLLTVGVDSLVAFSISNSLRSALGKHNVSEERKLTLTPRFVYTHPTINALTKALYNLVYNNMSCRAETSVDLQRNTMNRLRANYTAGLGEWPHGHSHGEYWFSGVLLA
jgi:Phosphopantetheine attachment site.